MFELDISKISNKSHLNKIEETILTYIINNIDNVKEIGVRGIAKQHYTSTTTIMNLSKKLGYSGFLDMYYNLYFTLKNKKNHHDREISNDYFGANVEEILSLINDDSIDKFVDMLIENKNETIYTCGQGFSLFIVEYITRKLLVIGFNCILSEAYESYDVNPIKAKIFINVSKSGETDFLVDVSKSSKKNSIKVVSFTGDSENTISKLSDINFKICDMHTIDDRNKLSNSFYANVIMLFEILVGKYLERVKNN
ncbi:MurR/RpiR family transcriptional regulator [Clostridium arbusti]|uniref:MurR/RpiR family transcriptional regulator n=1 Tax=Clostridium arbusti TaxID=1137848 RepID=UPI0002882ED2|nr:MurR/RpiR family transcriptional regulator [Clostridium arbusti]